MVGGGRIYDGIFSRQLGMRNAGETWMLLLGACALEGRFRSESGKLLEPSMRRGASMPLFEGEEAGLAVA